MYVWCKTMNETGTTTRSNLRADTPYFTYHNMNPKGKHTGDCVIRAIAYALNKDWHEMVDDLVGYTHKYMIPYDYAPLYERYLKDHGYVRVPQQKNSEGKVCTVYEVCRKLDRLGISKPVLMHVRPHHLTVVSRIDGVMKVVDIWNSNTHRAGKLYIHEDDMERWE